MNDQARFLYVHIAKTGGVTFRQVLEDNCKVAEILHCTPPEKILEHDDQSLKPYRLVHGHFNTFYTRHLTGLKKITTLRTPVERCVSAYNFWSTLDAESSSWSIEAKTKIRAAQSCSLEGMINHSNLLIRNTFHNMQTRILSGEHDVERPLTEKHLALAIHTLRQFDFIGLNSELESSMQLLSYKYGLFLPKPINALNRTIHPRRNEPTTALTLLKQANQLDAKLLEWANRRGLYRLNRITPPMFALTTNLRKLCGR